MDDALDVFERLVLNGRTEIETADAGVRDVMGNRSTILNDVKPLFT
jgi:hypothetical protein